VAAATGNGDEKLTLRLGARSTQAALLRAHLRIWLAEQGMAEDEMYDILLAANEAFGNALVHSRQPRSIAVHVDATVDDGVAEIAIRDHGRWQEDQRPADGRGLGLQLMNALVDSVEFQIQRDGTTVRLRRILRHADAPPPSRLVDRLDLLRRSSMFSRLPEGVLEELAGQLIPFSASADETIIHEGDRGEIFYLIAQGRLDVSADSRHVATLGPGSHVGEIALLRDTPRTATIVAEEPVELYALPSDDFLSAVRSRGASVRAAEAIVADRLAGLQSVLGRVPVA
jgi:anti-sigma regulatory factor (Ser/Thr protein kinase)